MKRPKALEKLNYSIGLRTLWVFVMFDLPTTTPAHIKAYTKYRKELLKDGFVMMQYSIYYRHCASTELAEVHINRMQEGIPSEGEVRFLTITDKQFGKMKIVREKGGLILRDHPHNLNFSKLIIDIMLSNQYDIEPLL